MLDEFAMSTLSRDRLFELLWGMDIDVNMYLCGELPRSQLIPRIVESCREMRQHAMDDTAEVQIVKFERVASGLSDSPALAGALKRQPPSDPDESQLMKGLFDLRVQLLKARRSMH